ncbi:MAG: cobalamin biosynthesis protein CbiD [Geobacteraceae bacterium]|nr:cobalamin biosynthesis protein CbiD [Geobacteraceae bacterium]
MKSGLKHGYTTGACAAAAARGAALMLREQRLVDAVEIILPTGASARFTLHGQILGKSSASCFVIKDAGDDPDITNGAEIHATLAIEPSTEHEIKITGGIGVGRVTKPGLAAKVGESAINPVPRRMIFEAVNELLSMHCSQAAIIVTISIPNGEELAKKTLNERLGIVGGLSILGTTGIVKPISTKAWTDTIDCSVDVALASGSDTVVLSTGRTSEQAVQKYLENHPPSIHPYQGGSLSPSLDKGRVGEGLAVESFIMMGDHVGYALRSCKNRGVKNIVLAGQFAKLLKIACGHEQTHVSSSELDLRNLALWCATAPGLAGFEQLSLEANTARQVLVDSDYDAALIRLVCEKARSAALQMAPGLAVRVLLAGYQGEVLHYTG